MSAPLAGAGQPVLELRHLCVDYGRGDQAVHAVIDTDLTLRRGEVVGLAGESGSGKSTLAYGATRLLRQPAIITGGSVLFRPSADRQDFVVDILDASPQTLRSLRWRDVALVFQSAMNSLNPVLTVQAQLTDTLAAHLPDSSKYERRQRAAGLLTLVGISADRLHSFPHELSGGMKQRVMIAMALALDPQVVIMDEPTTALDVVTQRQIVEQVIRLRDQLGFSVLFITHDLSLLIEIADSIAVMYAGRLVERAEAAALFRAPRHPYSLGLLSSFPSLHGARRHMIGIPGSPPDLRQLPAGCSFHPRCPYVMDRCRTDLPPLLELHEGNARQAACWLQDGSAAAPAALALPAPSAGRAAEPGPAESAAAHSGQANLRSGS